MKLVTNEEMTEIDSVSQSRFGIPGSVFMESAGLSAWRCLAETLAKTRQKIVFVAGSGNNGGDALVMARYCHLSSHHQAIVVLAKDIASGDAAAQLSIVRALQIPLFAWDSGPDAVRRELAGADLIAEGITGTGITGALRSPVAELVELINEVDVPVVSVDCPSGVGDLFATGLPSVHAALTLTMGLPKRCLYLPAARANCGTIRIVPVTFPAALTSDPRIRAELMEPDALSDLLPRLPVEAYKTSRGVVAVFAGSVGYTGAAALASEASLRSRAGLVTLFVDHEIYPILATKLTSVIVRPLDEGGSGAEASKADLLRADAVVVGPGWGAAKDREEVLRDLLRSAAAGVIDADAITVLGGLSEPVALGENWILTPHPGELARFLGTTSRHVLDDPIGSLKSAVDRTKSIVLLKAHTTWVAHPDGRLAVIDGANPALGTAGSGDVLAGTIGGLIPNLGPWDAARAGALLHAMAGKELFQRSGFFLSEELLPEISRLAATPQRIVGDHGA